MQAYVSNPYEKYRQQGVMTASPAELVVMLYSGGIKQVQLAQLSMEKHDTEAANTALNKAQAIVSELSMSLDRAYDISSSLSDLYEFVLDEIIAAYTDRNIRRLDGVVDILGELKEAWEVVARESKKTRYAALEG